ncbi:plant cysteine oxidase 2-like [Juglans microcarpa x Juglans regia]|uniref:plant cysteine oxidase 2-like n=1 Tax=Juglans microcarpa x Juglans regia TaxID=2249226 RepID=UPI001B7F57CB|nr:plant cysteine oxidase 2-like [Juglans microcarpa x Juglans regia]XP_041008356.1 plant cysteine oxidase 2-like [Juglans microcarpa x Juglans regia]
MGIETTRTDRKGNKEFRELPKATDTTSKSKTRKSRRRQKKMSPVQMLFETCKEVFANSGTGIVPSTEDIERLRAVLDKMKPEDVGLSPEMLYFRTQEARRTPAITYLHLYESEKFSMGIFCLPPNGVIPLHNHPGMTVFSKLLFGTMHIKSYDWVVDAPNDTSANENPLEITAPAVRLAKVKVDSDFTAPCNASILYPADGGNMHCFTAVTACAVLDVLGPPYSPPDSDPDGRHCTYFREFPFTSVSVDGVSVPEEEREGHAWLQELDQPEDLEVVGALYIGPEIVDK